ncbi:MAG: HD domain-containing phosphohydrolase [Pseudomonadota bacterium]
MQPSLHAPHLRAGAPTVPPRPEGIDAGLAWCNLTERLTPTLLAPQAEPHLEAVLLEVGADLISLVHHDPDVAIYRLVNPTSLAMRNYGVEHCVHTAVLMTLIAEHKEWSEEQTLHAVCAALTMNLAVTQLQTDLANQPEPPSIAQKETIHHHPLRSRDLLVAAGIMHMDWLRAVQEHHEQHNGTGYPLGLRSVSPLSDALRTCDMFCAKLSERTSRGQLLSTRAAQEIFRQNSYGYFGATIVRLLGMYPPGCLIKLLSGSTAVVLQRTTDAMRPRVALLTHDSGEARDTPVYSATGVGPGTSIVSAVPHNELSQRFSLAQLYAMVP